MPNIFIIGKSSQGKCFQAFGFFYVLRMDQYFWSFLPVLMKRLGTENDSVYRRDIQPKLVPSRFVGENHICSKREEESKFVPESRMDGWDCRSTPPITCSSGFYRNTIPIVPEVEGVSYFQILCFFLMAQVCFGKMCRAHARPDGWCVRSYGKGKKLTNMRNNGITETSVLSWTNPIFGIGYKSISNNAQWKVTEWIPLLMYIWRNGKSS